MPRAELELIWAKVRQHFDTAMRPLVQAVRQGEGAGTPEPEENYLERNELEPSSDAGNIGRARGLWATSRGNPLVVGRRYRALRPLQAFGEKEDLIPGEIIRCEGSGYSPKDSSSVFLFVTDSGQQREWFLSDSQLVENWCDLLAPL